MAFEIKTKEGNETAFRQDFSTVDLESNGFQTDALNFSFPFGEVKGRQWIFDGLRMIYSETEYKDYVELDWKGDAEMINMMFVLKGKIAVKDSETQKIFEFSTNQHNIFYGKQAEGTMKVDELIVKSFMIQLSKNAFLKIAENGNESIKRFVENVVNGKPIAFSDSNLDIDFAIHNCIQTILNCSYSDELKRMFLSSKVIELLVLQAESYNKRLTQTNTIIKTDYDRERILFARDYLIKNISCPPTLAKLSHISGINEFKLKKGFKEIFNLSVFQYLADVRLGLAHTDLLEKKKSITQIAFELGYSSVQHFNTAFKKKFGMSPGQVR